MSLILRLSRSSSASLLILMKAVEWYVSILRVVAMSRVPFFVSLVLRMVSAIRWG